MARGTSMRTALWCLEERRQSKECARPARGPFDLWRWALPQWQTRAPDGTDFSLGLFRSRVFSGANAITLLLYFALGGVLFFLPFNLIRIQGYSDARGRRLPALYSDHGRPVALVRWARSLLRRAKAADDRLCHRGSRVSVVRAPRHRRILLDDVLPSDGGARSRHGCHICWRKAGGASSMWRRSQASRPASQATRSTRQPRALSSSSPSRWIARSAGAAST
jgi:hypothetical protein